MSPVDKTSKPTYWKSAAEREGQPAFRALVEREFAEPLEPLAPDAPERRRFMQIMGASLALAGLSGCRWKEDKLMPLPNRPEGWVPGETRQYASVTELSGVGVGVMVTSYEGRPIKVDGNPAHPNSRGGASAFQQAAILEFYDPDRSGEVARRSGARTASSWAEFESFVKEALAAQKTAGGSGLRVLAEPSNSPTQRDLRIRLLTAFPQAKWYVWEPLTRDNELFGSSLAFGKPHRTHRAFDRASVIVSLDADVIAPTHPAGLANARSLAQGRIPERGTMSRIYAIESSPSLTGVTADHRLALRSELIKAFAAALDAALAGKVRALPELGNPQQKPNAAFLADPGVTKFLDALVADLLANVGSSLIVAGSHQPPDVHALVHRLNAVLGNIGNTITYTEEPDAERPTQLESMKALVGEMNAGTVDTLLIIGGNPVYDAPADLGFGAALAKVKNSIRLGLYEDETSAKCGWYLPQAHWLEAWGDAAGWDGTVSIAQPAILPLHGGRSTLEVLALFLGQERAKGLDLVRRTHQTQLPNDKAWRKAVHDGVVPGSAWPLASPQFKPLVALTLTERELGGMDVNNGQFEIVFAADRKVYDGRYANNGWLQELPEPISKLTWDNAAYVSPKTAKALGLTEGNLVTLSIGGKSLKMMALIIPGQANGSVRVALGYGRRSAGRVGGHNGRDDSEVAGFDTYQLRTTEAFWIAPGLSLASTSESYMVAAQQDLHSIDPIGQEGQQQRMHQLVRETTLADFRKHPDFARHVVHHPPLLNLWQDPVTYDGHKWGMSIDLNKCIGCSACVTACQAENNIPIVGKQNVERSREMTWIRIDRYFRGDENDPSLTFQPVTCHQCENAPCESVCPVGATTHSAEGLNDMAYNRCIGTRYCSNNCPYKVRRFNFFNYHLDKQGITPFNTVTDKKQLVLQMAMNPEVTLRARGVMEKCTYCVQRIMKTRIKARNAKRPIKDGEIKTACQETCPTEAIVFGDLNDKQSKVAQVQNLPRSYAMLAELNTRPRTQYVARIRNPNPALEPPAPAKGHEGHGASPKEHG
jgi:molybdopterin-containing oxidoreductase family iron-sulfur binding subunit